MLKKIIIDPDKKKIYSSSIGAVRGDESEDEIIEFDDGVEKEEVRNTSYIDKYWNWLESRPVKVIKNLKNPKTGLEWYILGLAYNKLNRPLKSKEAFLKAQKKA